MVKIRNMKWQVTKCLIMISYLGFVEREKKIFKFTSGMKELYGVAHVDVQIGVMDKTMQIKS